MSNKIGNFIKRFLIFQFIFLFIFSKIRNPQKGLKDFSKRLKFIARTSQMGNEQIELIGNKSNNIFIFLFSSYFLFGLLAILNFNFSKTFAGLITIFMAIIYCNPISTIKKNFEKSRYEPLTWKLYIPSLEFILISILGLIMILSSFYSDNDEEEENKEEPIKEKFN